MHEPPEGYGQESYPGGPQGQGGYPPPYQGQGQQPPYQGQQPPYDGGYPGQNQQPPYGGQQGGGWGQGGGNFGPPPGQGGGWGPPPEPPKKNSGPMIVVAIVAVLVVLGGGGAIVWALSGSKGDDRPTPPVAASSPIIPRPSLTIPSFTPPVIPSYTPPTIPGITPRPSGSSTYDESLFVREGDCVKISGKPPKLRMNKLDCDDDAPYKVLKRFSGTSDQSKCKSVSGYTTAFYAKSKKYTFLSYVLCLKRR